MSLVAYAEQELNLIGMFDDDDMNGSMRRHLLHMVKEFGDEGHSGFSGSYALQCLKKLLNFKPLSPLTGDDDEWHDVYSISGVTRFQNKRCSSVFKDGKDGESYDIDGKVFWEWYKDDDGNVYKSHYTAFESRVPVKFPYIVPDEPIYEWRVSSHDPQQPQQTEEGFV